MKKSTGKYLNWVLYSKTFRYPRRIFNQIVTSIIKPGHGVAIYYNDADRAKVLDLIGCIKKTTDMRLADNEAYQIFMAVKNTGKIEGDIAEVGVYKGGSATIICEAKGNKALYLFDTFCGLPSIQEIDSNKFHVGQYSASFEEVKNHLNGYNNVYIYQGLFPATADPIQDKKFSFVNLDVDIYQSTNDCLEFFYPRMNRGGIIISHDYLVTAKGVRKAFDDFFKDKPEPIIEMSGTQCLVVKI
jgi:O-methyltransferase